tara:strand:- start:334 stop:1266 length:933 start_codon:yes stop_codon:yes gene_type:complete
LLLKKIEPKNLTSISGIPSNIKSEIRSMGKLFDARILEQTKAMYLPLLKDNLLDDIKLERDISYGSNERNLLDIHFLDNNQKNKPVIIFFHGGGFTGGHKNVEGDLLHGNIPNFFVRRGMIGVNATYRLAPEARWPDGAFDVASTLSWTKKNIGAYGGDPSKIILFGQSAGATHVATYTLRKKFHIVEDGPGCAGAILMSGVYGINSKQISKNQTAYFGDRSSNYGNMSILENVDYGNTPVMISSAEYDPLDLAQFSIELLLEISVKFGIMPRFKQMLGHNHVSQVYSFGSGDDSVGLELIDFVGQVINI